MTKVGPRRISGLVSNLGLGRWVALSAGPPLPLLDHILRLKY